MPKNIEEEQSKKPPKPLLGIKKVEDCLCTVYTDGVHK